MALEVGEVFAGYVVERLLGAGGMGEVYVARHPRLPRSDALKVLAPQFAADPQFRARFEREADLAASLSHHSIVSVHDRGEFGGHLWMALELIDGRDVAALLRENPRGVSGVEAVRIVSAVGDALDYAGARGLIHRDVKPANILLSSAGGVLLTDFGIARMGPENSELTATGTTVGTLNYSSPEQLRGDVLDPRSDQYALAATVFHLLTGGVPFADTNAGAVIIAHATRPVPSVRVVRPDLPPAVDRVIARGMAKDPQHRYPTAREFAAALAAAVPQTDEAAPAVAPVGADRDRTVVRGEFPPEAPTAVPSPGPHVAQRSRKRGFVVAGAAIVVVIAVVLGVVAVVGSRGTGEGDGAVSSEAASLTPVLATPLMPSLNGAPTQSRWTFQGPEGGWSRLLGGDDKRILVTYYPGRAIDVLDADSGKSLFTVSMPEDKAAQQCALSGQAAMCTTASDRNSGLVAVDLAARRATPIARLIKAPVAAGGVFVDGWGGSDGFWSRPLKAGDRVLRADGSVAWTVPSDATSVDGGASAGVVALTTTTKSADPLVKDASTLRILRLADGKVLAEAPGDTDWGPFQGGFSLVKTSRGADLSQKWSAEFYDLDGKRRGTFENDRGIWPIKPENAPPSLPAFKVGNSGRVAVVNPDTGTVLWTKDLDGSVAKANKSIRYTALGRQIVIGVDGGPFQAFDMFTAESVLTTRYESIKLTLLGTDGKRLLVLSDYGPQIQAEGQGGWSSRELGSNVQVTTAGSGIYTGAISGPIVRVV